MITPAQRAEIRRLYYGEHWKLGTIAAQLGLHRETVRAAVEHESGSVRGGVCRPTALDPYLPFIRDTLAQYPRLRATRIHEMVRQRGYPGSVIQVRRLVRRLRPESTRTVYRRVVTLIGEQAQVDWGSFGKVRIGHGTRAVSGFVMVLGYSRAIAALFTLDQTLESFLRGHVEAFDALGGTARTLVYDNLRSAVLDRRGAAVQFHPRLLELAGHYHFAPRPCTPGRGNEKGKIERQIQYLRHAFFAARPFRDLDDLNAQFRRWRDDVAHQRRHPEQPDRTVAEVWADEKPRLLPLPAHPFETELVRVVRSGKTPYVRFDRNLYSIPHTHVRKPLTLLASDTRVRILDQQTELARHRRTYDTAQTVEDPAHLEGLLAATRQANVHTTRDRLRVAVPATAALFERLAERGEALRPHATRLLALLDDYGPKELAAAVDDALQRDALGAGSITHILETRRRQRGLKPPLRLTLPDRPGLRDLDVRPHDLETYDALGRNTPDDAGRLSCTRSINDHRFGVWRSIPWASYRATNWRPRSSRTVGLVSGGPLDERQSPPVGGPPSQGGPHRLSSGQRWSSRPRVWTSVSSHQLQAPPGPS